MTRTRSATREPSSTDCRTREKQFTVAFTVAFTVFNERLERFRLHRRRSAEHLKRLSIAGRQNERQTVAPV